MPPSAPGSAVSAPVPGSRVRRRLLLAAAGVLTVGCGLAVRGLPGIAGDAAGGVLYAVLVYLLVAFAAAGRVVRPLVLAGTAVVLCWLVELFQLTGWPSRLGQEWPAAHLVLGSTFNPWDLAAYAAGGAAAAAADQLFRRLPARAPAGRASRAVR